MDSFCYNCNGLLGKIIEVKALLFAVKFDILAISETHLRSSIKDSSILYLAIKSLEETDPMVGKVVVH